MSKGGEYRRFHEQTKHNRERLAGPGWLDWENEPRRVKVYPGAVAVELPAPERIDATLADIIAGGKQELREKLPLAHISSLLYSGYGVVRATSGHAFRAAPAAGALYPADVYLCCGDFEGLAAGFYYYDPLRHTLIRVVAGDCRDLVTEDAGGEAGAAAYLLLSVTPWRSAWKYGARAARYCLLDAGHLAGNLLLAAEALGLAPAAQEVAGGGLPSIDGEAEFPVAAIALHTSEEIPVGPEPVGSPAMPLTGSGEGVRDYGIAEVLSVLPDAYRVKAPSPEETTEGSIELPRGECPARSLGKLIAERRSYRGGARTVLPLTTLAAYLDCVSWRYPAAWMPGSCDRNLLSDSTLLVLDVEGVESGIYRFDAGGRRLLPTGLGLDRGELVAACIGQRFVAAANAVLLLAFDFETAHSEAAFRTAGLDAGIVGQLAYLGAGAIGAGCCGIGAFFDEELAALAGLDGKGRVALYALTLAAH